MIGPLIFFQQIWLFLKPNNGEFQEICEEITIYSFFILRSRFLPKRLVQAVCLSLRSSSIHGGTNFCPFGLER